MYGNGSDENERILELLQQQEEARNIVTASEISLRRLGISLSVINKDWPYVDHYPEEFRAAVFNYIEARKISESLDGNF